jgi:hypothetical protein
VAHREVPVKVTAWVDEGVAPLVEALNSYDQIVTLDSCEGHGDERGAYVLFACTGKDAAAFASELGKALSGEHDNYLLRAEWRPEQDEPLLELACPSAEVAALAASVSACRTKLFAGGRRHRALRS